MSSIPEMDTYLDAGGITPPGLQLGADSPALASQDLHMSTDVGSIFMVLSITNTQLSARPMGKQCSFPRHFLPEVFPHPCHYP